MTPSSGQQAVAIAMQWIGTPYQWGGGHSGPVAVGTPVDCSGLVNQVYGINGTTYTQVQMGTAVANLQDAQLGDLVFFGPLVSSEAYHVGIYSGAGMMIDAPHTGTSVRVDRIAGFGNVDAIRRLISTGDGSVANQGGSVQFDYAQLEGIWILANGNAQNAPMAAAIAMAESGGNSAASNTNSNGSTDRGLWQINSSNGSASSFDIMTNARAAVQMSNNGNNWRPWCTAYSDGACGTKGGTYQGAGAPYQKYLRTNIPPDCNVPINGTNAQLTGVGIGYGPSQWGSTIKGAVDLPTKIIDNIIMSVLNPIIGMIVGTLGIAAGGLIMILGIYEITRHSESGRQAIGSVKQGAGYIQSKMPQSTTTAYHTMKVDKETGQVAPHRTLVTQTRRGGSQYTSVTKQVLRDEAWQHIGHRTKES